ncbi:MAG: hypothetical protein RBS80_24545 [Thermoguttaceae bacterium]|nr:hypothetical protein [Thermoguttaceae bacterium]
MRCFPPLNYLSGRARTALVAVVAFLLAVAPALGQTYTWTGSGTNNNWNEETNWDAAGLPVSGPGANVWFDNSSRYSPIQNLADPFVLNRLDIRGPSSASTAYSIVGSQLQFMADGAAQPRIYSNRWATSTISNDIHIPVGTTLHVDLTTYHLNLTGVISGEGGIDKSSSAGGIDLRNSANSFSGGLTIRASDSNWRKVNVTASGAMGTGPVNLHGGTLGTSHTSPGGLIFFGTTSHANTVNLFEDSPIFAGLPAGTADVELTGDVNLGTHTLHLRGGGVGTITGEVTGSGCPPELGHVSVKHDGPTRSRRQFGRFAVALLHRHSRFEESRQCVRDFVSYR